MIERIRAKRIFAAAIIVFSFSVGLIGWTCRKPTPPSIQTKQIDVGSYVEFNPGCHVEHRSNLWSIGSKAKYYPPYQIDFESSNGAVTICTLKIKLARGESLAAYKRNVTQKFLSGEAPDGAVIQSGKAGKIQVRSWWSRTSGPIPSYLVLVRSENETVAKVTVHYRD